MATTSVMAGEGELTPCPQCGGPSRVLHRGHGLAAGAAPDEPYRIARVRYTTPLPVHRCRSCGLAWAASRYHLEAVLAGYEQAVDPEYTEEEAARRLTFRRGLERVKEIVGGGRLLDVGASTGFLLAEARDLGFEVAGVEPSSWAAAEAKRRYGLELQVGGLEAARFPDGSFDAVTLVDVIEHLVDPPVALAEVARLVRPGGVLYLVTPDIDGWPARLLGRYWWGFEPWHLWFYNRPSLEAVLAGAGFRVVGEIGYHRRTFSIGYWLRKGEGLVRPAARALGWLARVAGIARRDVTINLRDGLEVVARKEASG